MKLKGKTALVTGATGGIGRAIAIALAASGANVCFQYRDRDEMAHGLLDELQSYAVKAHSVKITLNDASSSKELIDECVQEFGSLDVLVNCIGDFLFKPLSEQTPQDFREIIHSNLNIAFDLCHYGLPHLRANKEGRIVNLGYSTATQIEAKPRILPYHIAKMGLVLLTKSFSYTEAENNVLINCVSPGIAENSIEVPTSKIPLGRPAKLAELADAVLFLLQSDYITGTNLEVDGGWRGRYLHS